MAYRASPTDKVLLMVYCSLIYVVCSASCLGVESDLDTSLKKEVDTDPKERVFYCTEVEFPEDILCDLTNATLDIGAAKGVVPKAHGELIFSNGDIGIIYRFKGGGKLARFEYETVLLYKIIPYQDVKMDEFYSGKMEIERKYPTLLTEFELLGKITGKLGDGSNDNHARLMKYWFNYKDDTYEVSTGGGGYAIIGREKSDYFEVSCANDGRRCRPKKKN